MNPLQLVQDECDRLAAKYKLRAYVRTKSAANKADHWGENALCQVIINDTAKVEIGNEWAEYSDPQRLRNWLEEAFHRVGRRVAVHQLHQLAVAGRR